MLSNKRNKVMRLQDISGISSRNISDSSWHWPSRPGILTRNAAKNADKVYGNDQRAYEAALWEGWPLSHDRAEQP